ncbi:unnamed protein product [Spirodela intermedia]|uniref:Glycoside hydrolase family 5 domain-containing protein n=1 Tax=Spirodela intermedia TaxID=51605 RepID=A0A7I8L5G2_SPIIN|nr:unnamed protein product [Spirodela intermedia]
MRPFILHVFFFFFLHGCVLQGAAALSTSSRWIVDDDGSRVKMACVNWAAHLEGVVAEGLSRRPLDSISKKISSLGFNCVRLTWPLFLATNDSLASLTVRESFLRLALHDSIVGVEANNPELIDAPLIQAFQAAVASLGRNNIMVILDNHTSKPGWCCSASDGSGFFGDLYFDPEEWLRGLARMATLFSTTPAVVAMSLRNELRGPRQNAVHAANPNALVILSGLSFSTDLSFLRRRQLDDLPFARRKLVFEFHWYAFSDGQAWARGNPNQVCATVAGGVMRRAGFLLEQGWPLLMSEFGADQRGTNVNDRRYLSCALAAAAHLDLDWALWALQGSYYIREGTAGVEEVYGLLSSDWCSIRNATFLQRISALQSPFLGPGLPSSPPYQIIFHPASGLCLLGSSRAGSVRLGRCTETEAWSHTAEGTLALRDTSSCLRAEGAGKQARISTQCGGAASRWAAISDSKMHLASQVPGDGGGTVCLDVGADGTTAITNPCECLTGGGGACEPERQWFRIVSSARPIAAKSSAAAGDWGYLKRVEAFDVLSS